MEKKRGFITIVIHWAPAVIWMGVIFLLSSRHSVRVSDTYVFNFLFFKTLHVIEYAILYLTFLRATGSSRASFVLTLCYAGADEFHQRFVPTREGTLRDVIIDGSGALVTWFILKWKLPKAPKRLVRLVHALLLR